MVSTSKHALLLVLLLVLAACGGSASTDGADGNDQPAPAAAEQGQSSAAGVATNQEPPPNQLPGRLLFVQAGTIWLWQGEEPRPLLGDGAAWQPAWSPDGSRIAYVERNESSSDVLLADATGQPLYQLTFNGSDYPPRSHEYIYDSRWVFYPTWEADGSSLIIVSQEGTPFDEPAVEHNLSLFRIPASAGSRRTVQLLVDREGHSGQVALAPGGDTLVYSRSSSEQDGEQQLYRLALDETGTRQPAAPDSEPVPVPGAPQRSYDPTFSPDGRWLVFVARDDGMTDLWALPVRSTSSTARAQRLTTMGRVRAPVFSPDGSLLAFLAMPPGEVGFELWVVAVQTDNGLQLGPPRQLTADMQLDADSGLSWGR